jgi:nitrous oxidase accessory protein
MFSRRVRFEGNRFVKNRGFSAVGVLFKDAYETTAVDNLYADNTIAMVLDNSMQNLFERNHFVRNDIAVHLFSGSDANTFTQNNFLENLSPILLVGKRTTTRWSQDGRGNHWSDYQGYDLDGDGIGDVPHRIENVFEFLEAEHPPLRLYLVSPVAAAIRAGERAFPMFEFSREVDAAPLVRPVAIPAHWSRPAGASASHRSPAWAGVFLGSSAALGLLVATTRRGPRRRTAGTALP